MSDPLVMSLDDIIKQKRKKPQRTRVLALKGANAKRGKSKLPGLMRNRFGRVSRNFQIQRSLTKNVQTRGNFRRGNSRRYFNSPRSGTSYQNWKTNGITGFKRNWRNTNQQAQTQFQGVGRGRIRMAPWRNRNRNQINRPMIPFRSLQPNNRQGKLRFAQKSINRARRLLMQRQGTIMNRGIASNRNYAGFGTGRIMVGRFGLVTTRKQNLVHRQTIMQQKILRARRIRQQGGQFGQRQNRLVFSGTPRGRRRIRNNVQPWSPSFTKLHFNTFRSDNTLPSSSSARVNRVFTDDWSLPLMKVQNNRFNERVPSASTSRASVLDPDIQKKIHFIQEQGRLSRGEHKQENYDDVYDDGSNFRSAVISTSSRTKMSLSDRFSRFMNH